MTRLIARAGLIAVCGSLFWVGSADCFGQSSSSSSASSSSSSNQGAAQAGSTGSAAAGTAQDSATATPADKKKKVWTNEDVGSLSGPVSVVGNSKGLGKPEGDGKADPQYIANVKKQLEKLQSQLDDTDKQLAAYKDVADGKSSTSAGYQLNKGYNRVPVDQQIASLEDKKKDIQGKIDALLDEARKKGVKPGDLR
jgi:hypothetical protein